MENIILDKAMIELNWREKIIVKMFRNTFRKVYAIAGKNTFNNYII